MVRREYNKISNESREKIIRKFTQGLSTKAIADALDLKYCAVVKIVNAYQRTGNSNKKVLGGDKRSKLNEHQKIQLKAWVDENCLLTLKELKLKIESVFGLSVSLSTIDRCLGEFHYTLKLVTTSPTPRNTENAITQRFEYSQTFRDFEVVYGAENLIFLDEVGFSVSSRPKKGRSIKGTSAIINVPAARSRNISVLGAMNKNGMIYSKINDRPFNGEIFKDSLVELKAFCNQINIISPVFIMDNARIHHYSGLMNVVEEFGFIVKYLPPYSPFLNPIENCFSKWKNFVIRGCAKNEVELKSLIERGFGSITESDCDGFYRKMLRYVIKSERREEIFE